MAKKIRPTLTNTTNVSIFPEDITIQIFSRLPIKSLMRFKCLSKYFAFLVDEIKFFVPKVANEVGGPPDHHDQVFPAWIKCAVCEHARKNCEANCEFRQCLPGSKLLEYKAMVKTYTKKNLFGWLKSIPEDKKSTYFDYRIEESLNIQGDLLGGNAKIIHNQAARIRELEEQVKQKDVIISEYGGFQNSQQVHNHQPQLQF